MRRKGKVDTNQQMIVEALRSVGATVYITSSVGAGFPDLVVGWKGYNFLVEVKSRYGKHTKDQIHFMKIWRGHMVTCRDLEDIAALLDIDVMLLKFAARKKGVAND